MGLKQLSCCKVLACALQKTFVATKSKKVRTRRNLRLILHLWLCKHSLLFRFVPFLSVYLSLSLSSFFFGRATADKCANGKELLPSCASASFTSHFLNVGSIRSLISLRSHNAVLSPGMNRLVLLLLLQPFVACDQLRGGDYRQSGAQCEPETARVTGLSSSPMLTPCSGTLE